MNQVQNTLLKLWLYNLQLNICLSNMHNLNYLNKKKEIIPKKILVFHIPLKPTAAQCFKLHVKPNI